MKNNTLIQRTSNSSSENAALANEIINNVGKVTPAKRTRYTVELPNGLKVQTRSNKSYQELNDRFSEKSSESNTGKASVLSESHEEQKTGNHDFGPAPFQNDQATAASHVHHAPQPCEISSQTISIDPGYLAYLQSLARQNSAQGWPGAPGQQWPPPASPHHAHPSFPQYPPVAYCSARMSERTPAFLSWVTQKRYSRATLVDYRFTLRVFAELVGDKQVGDITNGDADIFLQAMDAWPCHASKKREFRKMKAPQVLAKAALLKVPTLTLRSQQKHIDRLKVFFRWLEQRQEIRPGLLNGTRLYKASQDMGLPRLPFEAENLQVIFDPKFDVLLSTPWRYWAPRLALYQGMRVNEIAQLYLEDIMTVDGVPFLVITKDRPGQRLKNFNSRRILPIHPEILKAGFMLYVKQVQETGLPHLFPGLVWGCNGPGDVIGDWFNRFLRKRCLITDRTLTFHSFRHSFATFGDRSNVPDSRMALLLGHSPGGSILRKHYVKRLTAQEKIDELGLIKFPPINMGLYNPRKFDWFFEREKAKATRKDRLDAAFGISR